MKTNLLKGLLLSITIIIPFFKTYGQIPVEDGLVSFYPFNGNANDESSNTNDGVVNGATLTTDRCDIPGSAYHFNGQSNNIKMGDVDDFDESSALTISAWIYTTGNIDEHSGTIVSKYDASSDYDRNFTFDFDRYGENTLRFIMYGADGNADYEYEITNDPLELSVWNHVVVTWNGLTHNIDFFVNGVKVNSTHGQMGNMPTKFYNKNSPLMIGACMYGITGTDYLFYGSIDDVFLFDRVLSNEEVLKLYYYDCQHITLTGESPVCQGDSNVAYHVISEFMPVVDLDWSYSGTGVHISGGNDSILIDFSENATSGILHVDATFEDLSTASSEITILVKGVPADAGSITGEHLLCENMGASAFSIPIISEATHYEWHFSGSGLSLPGESNYETAFFSSSVTDGNLTVYAVNNCGIGNSSPDFPIQIRRLPDAAQGISGPDEVCKAEGKVTYRVPVVENATGYIWSFSGEHATIAGDSDSANIWFFENSTGGNLSVYAINKCGAGQLSEPFPIIVRNCSPNMDFNIPNSFSPNGDNVNDLFIIRNLKENTLVEVFTRTGKKVYESDNYMNDWNGRDPDGNLLTSGTYWYIIKIPGFESEFKGFLYIKQ